MRPIRPVRSQSRSRSQQNKSRSQVGRYRRANFATCQVQSLRGDLNSVTTAIWAGAGRVFGAVLWGFQKTIVKGKIEEVEVAAPSCAEAEPSTQEEGEGGVQDVAAAISTSSASSGPWTDGGSRSNSSRSKKTDGGAGGYSSAHATTLRASLQLEICVVDSISKVPREDWDAVATGCGDGEVNPFLLWSFLNALEESGSAAPWTGWRPQHILVRQVPNGPPELLGTSDSSPTADRLPAAALSHRLVGCVPLYLKGHSYGEYVFDSAWADFAGMLGIRYYPKLQAAVPFTPVTGPRLMVSSALPPSDRAAVVRALGRTLIDMADSVGTSGVHLTFTSAQEWAVLAELGFKQRLGIQFHWENNGYGSFEDFLGDLKQSKRKSIRQERRSIERGGLTVQRLGGASLRAAHWDRFHSFYSSTVDRKWGNTYLTREFFQRLGEDMADRVLLVAAFEGASSSSSSHSSSGCPPAADEMVAAALNLVGSHALFGRNWGALEGREHRNLHFELCYYQALEEAIARRLPRVEAGAQGEHKLQRGYLPSFTYSCHYLRDPRLGEVVDKFLSRERAQIEYALQVMSVTSSPYKKERTVEALMGKLRSYNSLSSSSGSSFDEEDEEEEEAKEELVVVNGSGGGGSGGGSAESEGGRRG